MALTIVSVWPFELPVRGRLETILIVPPAAAGDGLADLTAGEGEGAALTAGEGEGEGAALTAGEGEAATGLALTAGEATGLVLTAGDAAGDAGGDAAVLGAWALGGVVGAGLVGELVQADRRSTTTLKPCTES